MQGRDCVDATVCSGILWVPHHVDWARGGAVWLAPPLLAAVELAGALRARKGNWERGSSGLRVFEREGGSVW